MAILATLAFVVGWFGQWLARYSMGIATDDQQVLQRIDELVKEEDDLLARHEGEGLSPDQHARLAELKIQLDRTWDFLRQRRALRQYGLDPEDASIRGPGTVENYEG